MPFRSEKQRRYLWMHEPELAHKWTKKYGSKPKPKEEHSPVRVKKREGTA